MEGAGTKKPIRANTFCIDYEGIPRRPSRKEVIDFIVDQLSIGDEIKAIQYCSSRGRVFVQMETADQAREVVVANCNKHAITIDGKTYTITLILEDGTTEVRLLELPSYITHEEIRSEMAKLGEVASIKDETYGDDTRVPGVLTGVRTVRLIPFNGKLKLGPTLTIAGERTPIKYPGQAAYCKYCLVPEHLGRTCAQTKRESYADMAKRTPAPITPTPTPKTPAAKTTIPNTQQKGKKGNVSRPIHTSVAQLRLDLARRNNLPQTPLKPAAKPSETSATKTPVSAAPNTLMEEKANIVSAEKPLSSARDDADTTPATSGKAGDAADAGRYPASAPRRKSDVVAEVLGRYDTASGAFRVPRDRSPPIKLPPTKTHPAETTDSDTESVNSVGSTRRRGRTRNNHKKTLSKEVEGQESGAMET